MGIKYIPFVFLFFFSSLNAQSCGQLCGERHSSNWFEIDEEGIKEIEYYEDFIAENESIITEAKREKSYRLKYGDILMVSIYGENGTMREVNVDPRGMISYLFVDSLPAIGRTIKEVRGDLQERLSSYYRFVVLSITPVKFGAAYYTISGEVSVPGRKPVIGNPTLLSAICQGGGVNVMEWRDQLIDAGDLDHAFLSRDGKYIPVDFMRLVRNGDLSLDVPIHEGDYIYIPDREFKQVFVLGEVRRGVTIDYLTDMSLAEAVAEAGGVTDRASSRVLVIRGSLAYPVRYLIDFTKIVKGNTCNFQLQPGDIVFVPPRKLQKLREIFYGALNTFVASVASAGGREAFIKIHPHAAGDSNLFFGDGVVVP